MSEQPKSDRELAFQFARWLKRARDSGVELDADLYLPLRVGDYVVDGDTFEVRLNGKDPALTWKEERPRMLWPWDCKCDRCHEWRR